MEAIVVIRDHTCFTLIFCHPVVMLNDNYLYSASFMLISLKIFHRQLPKIFDRFSSADGFLFLEDDTVLNYWNLLQADKTKLWIADKVPNICIFLLAFLSADS